MSFSKKYIFAGVFDKKHTFGIVAGFHSEVRGVIFGADRVVYGDDMVVYRS